MNILLSWMQHDDISVLPSEHFGAEIGSGLVDGLEVNRDIPAFSYGLEIHVGTHSRFLRRPIDVGDIGAALSFDSEIQFSEMFPAGGVNIRPQAARTWSTRGALIQIKRSSLPWLAKSKIDQFIKFYSKILKPGELHKYDFPAVMNGRLPHLLADINIPVVFLFDGADCQDCANYFGSKVPTWTIHGHPVAIVYVKADELTQWAFKLHAQYDHEQLQAQNAALTARVHQLEERLQAHDAV